MTQDEIKEYLDYNKETGSFVWKVSIKGSRGIGKEAGTLTAKGYKDVCIKGKKYGLHRLAFLFEEGVVPKCVDHKNGRKADNRWCNLRAATYSENGYNYRGTGSKTGFKNVYYDARGNKKFLVAITTDKKRKTYGYFMTPEEANEEAKRLRVLLHKGFANHGMFNEVGA